MHERLSATHPRYLRVNLTPMIDVVFLLLIFFVLIAQFSSRQQAQVQLPVPEPSAAKATSASDALTITVICDEQGKLSAYQIQGRTFDPQQVDILAQTLLARRKANSQVQVNLRADRRADARVIEALMAACGRAGIRHVNLMAALPPK